MAEDLDGNNCETPGWVNAVKYCGCNAKDLGWDVREGYKAKTNVPEPVKTSKLQKILDDYCSKGSE